MNGIDVTDDERDDEVVDDGPDDAEAVDAEAVDAELVDAENEPVEPARSTPRSSAWVAWTVAATMALLAGFAVLQWQTLAAPAGAVDEAAAAATDYVLTLSNWDAAEGLDETYTSLLLRATDAFQSEVDEVFGAQRRAELVAIDAVSTGVVLERLTGDLQEGDPDSVQVVVVVEQLVLTGPTADPALRTERVASVRMVRTDGGWLVDDLELLSELELTEQGAG